MVTLTIISVIFSLASLRPMMPSCMYNTDVLVTYEFDRSVISSSSSFSGTSDSTELVLESSSLILALLPIRVLCPLPLATALVSSPLVSSPPNGLKVATPLGRRRRDGRQSPPFMVGGALMR